MFCDGVVEMANMHARLQEEDDDSIEKTFASCYDYEEDDLHEIVSVIVTDHIIESMLQHRLVWVRNRSQAFTEISASWDNLEWKRNFWVNRTTFRYLCTSLSTNLQRCLAVRAPISVEKRIATALWRLRTNGECRTISHLLEIAQCS